MSVSNQGSNTSNAGDEEATVAVKVPPVVRKGFSSLLGTIKERRIVICIETSALSCTHLDFLREHIVEALLEQAERSGDTYFNLIEYNTEVTLWCSELVQCTTGTVAVAAGWLGDLKPHTSADTLGALLAALSDTSVEAVYLLASGPPDQDTSEILDALAYASGSRPVHTRLIVVPDERGEIDEVQLQASECFESIARDTSASFAMVEPAVRGFKSRAGQTTGPGVVRTLGGQVFPSENASNVAVTTTLRGDPLFSDGHSDEQLPPYHPYMRWASLPYPPYYSWSRYSQSKVVQRRAEKEANMNNPADVRAISQTGAALVLGRNVLARCYKDGLFYPGMVKKQLSEDKFLVMFGPFVTSDKEFIGTDYQDTRLLDLVDFDEAVRRPILPGDRVLAPDPKSKKSLKPFVPATVLEGNEMREKDAEYEKPADDSAPTGKPLTLAFMAPANRTETVAPGLAVFIADPLYRRLCLEGAMPADARDKLATVPHYPECSLPGYPTSNTEKRPAEYEVVRPQCLPGRELQVDHLQPPYCLPVYPVYERLQHVNRQEDVWQPEWSLLSAGVGWKPRQEVKDEATSVITGTDVTIKQLNDKVRQQLAEFSKPKSRGALKHTSDLGSSPTDTRAIDLRPQTPPPTPCTSSASEAVDKTHGRGAETEWNTWINGMLPPKKDTSTITESVLATSEKPPKSKTKKRRPRSRIDQYHAGHSAGRGGPWAYDRSVFLTELAAANDPSPPPEPRGRPMRRPMSAGPELSSHIGRQDIEREQRELRRLQHRRNLINQRLQLENERWVHGEIAADDFADAQRSRILSRIHMQKDKLAEDERGLERIQDFKRQIGEEIRAREKATEEVGQARRGEGSREKRIAAMKFAREMRESEKQERDALVQMAMERAETLKYARGTKRWMDVHRRIETEEANRLRREKQEYSTDLDRRLRLRRMLGTDTDPPVISRSASSQRRVAVAL